MTGLKSQITLFHPLVTPSIFAKGSIMSLCCPDHRFGGLRPPVATLPRTHGPLILDREVHRASARLYAGYQHILLSMASYHHAQELT